VEREGVLDGMEKSFAMLDAGSWMLDREQVAQGVGKGKNFRRD